MPLFVLLSFRISKILDAAKFLLTNCVYLYVTEERYGVIGFGATCWLSAVRAESSHEYG